ncbi:hypothetical protein TEA_027285 [Camellia sinensis var. sinensis]|uniref:F-box domain-containing protein n=1 Tax=Camellia sinensis var. sinensis TaxID=542762 RepID=A0A4S4D1C3_CAMSN|nr:hypothetical protein TEA_027285 [Camellia sinensis var. sinensis]
MAKPWKSKNSSEEALCNASNVSEEDKEKIEAVVKYKSPSTVNSAGHRQEQEQDHENEEEKMTKKISNKRRKLVTGCTPLQDSLAVEVISNVDLLSEILLRVPTKSLIRFKCVSKHWLSLISDSQFSSNHTRRTNISVISGLYFYSNWMLKDVNSVSLQSHSTLPPFTFLDGVGEESTLGAYLAFEPSKSPRYKVVLVDYGLDYAGSSGRSYLIDIYSSESASWKHVCVSAPPGGTFKRRVFWNGAIHWMNSMNLHIRFDVGENLTGTPMPPYPKILSEDKILYFGECHGHLFLIQNRQSFPVGFRILEMNRDYCCWNVMYRVNLRPIIDVFPSKIYPKFNVLCVVKGANEEDIALVLAIPGKVISYNLKSKTLKVLSKSVDWETTWYNTHQFIESLSPV